MRDVVDTERVLAENRRYHDEVEFDIYDRVFNVTAGPAACKAMVDELENVLSQPLPAGGTVLDVGTGTGNVAIKLALTDRFDRVFGTDISVKMLKEAESSARAAGCHVEFVKTDMMKLPFEDGSIDFLVGCAILHHLPDPVGFIPLCQRE